MNSGAAPLGAPLANELRDKLKAQGSNCFITQGALAPVSEPVLADEVS